MGNPENGGSTDACDVSRLHECMDNGHVPLALPGEEKASYMSLSHNPTNIEFGRAQFCRVCGLVYWEPAPPKSQGVEDG